MRDMHSPVFSTAQACCTDLEAGSASGSAWEAPRWLSKATLCSVRHLRARISESGDPCQRQSTSAARDGSMLQQVASRIVGTTWNKQQSRSDGMLHVWVTVLARTWIRPEPSTKPRI